MKNDRFNDVGEETGTTVAEDVTVATSRFTGKINFVQLDVGLDDKDHERQRRLGGRSRTGRSSALA